MCLRMNSLCCCRLSTVGVLVGWFYLICSSLSVIVMIVGFANLDDLVESISNQMKAKPADIRSGLIFVLSIQLAISAVNAIASCMLIVGAIRERHRMLIPWLFTYCVYLIVNILCFILMVYVFIAASYPATSAIIGSFGYAANLVIQYVIWNAIYSLYKEIRDRDVEQRLLPPTTTSEYRNYTAIPQSSA